MVKLLTLPDQAIIDGFKGTIDFYVHMGVPCCRKWPRKAHYIRSAAETETQIIFAAGVALWPQLSPEIQQAYNDMAVGTTVTGRDMFMRGYISGTLLYYQPVDALEEP